MKLNNKGFAISTVMYILLILALILIMATIGILNSRRMNLDKIKEVTLKEIKDNLNLNETYYKYNYGDVVKYRGIEYFVIQADNENIKYVTVLKVTPLTYNEISSYSSDIINTNNYGYVSFNGDSYSSSQVKSILDNWVTDNINLDDLKIVQGNGYQLFSINHYNRMIDIINTWREVPDGEDYYNQYINQLYLADCDYFLLNNNILSSVNSNQTITNIKTTDKYAIRPVLNIYKDRLDDANE